MPNPSVSLRLIYTVEQARIAEFCRRRFRALAPSHESRYLSFMPAVTLQAHYDGRHIVLDEPYDLPANASLMVTVLPSPADNDSEEAWLRAASSSDAFSFLADPAEDIYTLEDGSPLRDAP